MTLVSALSLSDKHRRHRNQSNGIALHEKLVHQQIAKWWQNYVIPSIFNEQADLMRRPTGH
jgi:hypothetical protein